MSKRKRSKSTPKQLEHRVPKAFLQDIHNLTGKEYHELRNGTIIGRGSGSVSNGKTGYLAIEWYTISRRHAFIEYCNNQFWLSDQGSHNGTFINGERIVGKVYLKDGDKIRFHDVELHFVQQETAVAQPTARNGIARPKRGSLADNHGSKKFVPTRDVTLSFFSTLHAV